MMSSRSSFLAMLALGAVVSIADVGFAQPGRGDRGRGWWGSGNMSTLLRDSKVQEELELVDDQIADLEEVQKAMREQMMKMFRGGGGFRDLDETERRERMEEMRTLVQEKMNEVDGGLGDILLPHQLDRLKQLQFQSISLGANRLRTETAAVVACTQYNWIVAQNEK